MTRTKKTLSLSILATLALAGLGNTTATALLPEFTAFHRCRGMRGIRGFSENVWRWTEMSGGLCATESGTNAGNFAESPFVSNLEPRTGSVVFETAGRRKIECTAQESIRNEISRAKKVDSVSLIFTNCVDEFGFRCNTPRFTAGRISTVFLEGEIGYIPNTNPRRVGIDIWPTARTLEERARRQFRAFVAEIECPFATLLVRGGLVGEVTPLNSRVMATFGHFTVRYARTGGVQAITALTGVEGEASNQLEASENGGAFENLGVAMTLEVLVAEEQEIKA